MPIPLPPPIPSTDEIYDMLMAAIEPDLVSSRIPLLKEKYKTESPEEKEVRRRRYNDAFAKFDVALKKYFDDLNEKIKRYKHLTVKKIEEKAREREQTQDMIALEHAFDEA